MTILLSGNVDRPGVGAPPKLLAGTLPYAAKVGVAVLDRTHVYTVAGPRMIASKR